MAETVKVFVSYSWGVEEETKIVDDLEVQCPQRNIKLIRDRNTMKHGDSIREFIVRLTGGEHVITVFSKSYFKSEWCMLELLLIWQKGDFQQRTHPLVADDCDLQDLKYRLEITDYWQDRLNELEELLAGRRAELITKEYEQLKRIRNIAQNINDIIDFARTRNTTPLLQLQEKNYSQLLKIITPLMSGDADSPVTDLTDTHNYCHAHISESDDSEFLGAIKENIALELESSSTASLRNALGQELGRLLVKLKLPELTSEDGEDIADSLVTALKKGGSSVPVITSVLMSAAKGCFERSGKYYKESRDHHDQIHSAIEQILGWLVLASVKDDYAGNLKPLGIQSNAVYFELPVTTLGGVEVIVSRNYQRQANINPNGSDLTGKHITHTKRSKSWKTSEITNQLMLEIWNRVLPDLKKDKGMLSASEIDRLNSELEIRRSDEWFTEHHILAIECAASASDQIYQETCKELQQKLNQLTLVRFGIADQQQVFYSPEHNLMSAVNRFLTSINRTINA